MRVRMRVRVRVRVRVRTPGVAAGYERPEPRRARVEFKASSGVAAAIPCGVLARQMYVSFGGGSGSIRPKAAATSAPSAAPRSRAVQLMRPAGGGFAWRFIVPSSSSSPAAVRPVPQNVWRMRSGRLDPSQLCETRRPSNV